MRYIHLERDIAVDAPRIQESQEDREIFAAYILREFDQIIVLEVW